LRLELAEAHDDRIIDQIATMMVASCPDPE
jgi:hypothetical protein